MPFKEKTVPITLLVMTYNEADNIARCLDSVPFAAEKIVVDSGSTDDTVVIAQQHGARVINQHWLGFGAQRNFASTQANNDWIIFLDADEALSAELSEELQVKLPKIMATDISAGIMILTYHFMGKPMKWYKQMAREKKARIYNRNRAKWSETPVHESLQYTGKPETFKAHFIHYFNPTLVHLDLKYLRYAELKALGWSDMNRQSPAVIWPFVFLFTFIKDYIIRLAFLDGMRGFIAAWLAANYSLYKRFRYYEIQTYPESKQLAINELRKRDLVR